jgi:hypothetical protein
VGVLVIVDGSGDGDMKRVSGLSTSRSAIIHIMAWSTRNSIIPDSSFPWSDGELERGELCGGQLVGRELLLIVV